MSKLIDHLPEVVLLLLFTALCVLLVWGLSIGYELAVGLLSGR